MWILPNNHPLSSAFAQGYAESNEDLKEYFEKSEPPLLWKSKPLSWKTFLLQWKRVWWLRHLSGRILKPSTRSLFEESLTELLAATHASQQEHLYSPIKVTSLLKKLELEIQFSPISEGGEKLTLSCLKKMLLFRKFQARVPLTSSQLQNILSMYVEKSRNGIMTLGSTDEISEILNGWNLQTSEIILQVRFYPGIKNRTSPNSYGGLLEDIWLTDGCRNLPLTNGKGGSIFAVTGQKPIIWNQSYTKLDLRLTDQKSQPPQGSQSPVNSCTISFKTSGDTHMVNHFPDMCLNWTENVQENYLKATLVETEVPRKTVSEESERSANLSLTASLFLLNEHTELLLQLLSTTQALPKQSETELLNNVKDGLSTYPPEIDQLLSRRITDGSVFENLNLSDMELFTTLALKKMSPTWSRTVLSTTVSPSPWPETEQERTTQDTSGLSFDDTLRSYNQDGVFSKMLQDTLHSDSMSSSANWKKWVTGLRLESTQRRKSARLIAENDSSSLPSDSMWLTPRVMEVQESYETYLKRMQASPNPKNNTKTRPGNLSMQVQMIPWPTPDCSDRRSAKSLQQGLSNKVKGWSTPRVGRMEGYQTRLARGKDAGLLGEVQMIEEQLNWPTPTTTDSMEPKTEKALIREATETRPGRTSFSNLRDAVVTGPMKSWPTPVAHETRLGYQDRTNGKKGSQESLTTTVLNTDFPQVKEYISTNGKSPARLNPAWSIQLMGTTLQKTFTVPLVIPLLNKPQNLHSETSLEKCTTGSNLSTDDWVNS